MWPGASRTARQSGIGTMPALWALHILAPAIVEGTMFTVTYFWAENTADSSAHNVFFFGYSSRKTTPRPPPPSCAAPGGTTKAAAAAVQSYFE